MAVPESMRMQPWEIPGMRLWSRRSVRKENKDLLMSLGLLPLPQDRAEKDKILFERYRFNPGV